MRKLYFATLILFLLTSFSSGDVIGDTESMTPMDVNVFIKTRHIGRLLKTSNYIVYNIMEDEQREKALAERNSFRDKTGIDYLDEESLKNFGIDTSRPVSFAMFNRVNQKDVMVIFLPVMDERGFAGRFVEIIKKTNSASGGEDISPVVAKHEGVEITQIKTDMFVAGLGGYFLIGSTGEIVREVINVRKARDGHLMLSPEYRDYISREKNNYDVNAFITKKLLEKMNSSPKGEVYGSAMNENFILTQGEAGAESFDSNTVIRSIDYISAGLGFEGNRFRLNASVKLSSDDPHVDMLLGLLKTGENSKALSVQSADSTIFLSLNYRYLDNLCRTGIPMCAQYNQLKADLQKDAGIDFEKDILPYYSGVMNLFTVDSASSGGMGDVVLFLPVNDPKKSEELWGKFRKMAQVKYLKDKKFGDEKIDGKRGFWYIDATQMRFFVAYDNRGIYAGNSTGLMKVALKSETMDKAANSGVSGRILNEKTFFMININKNNFVKSMLQMRAQGNPGLGYGLSRIGTVNFYCEKNGKFVSADIDVEIKEGINKGK